MAHALEMVAAADPKAELWDSLGAAIDGIEVLGSRVLLGVFVRPETVKTAGGLIIHLTAKTRDEDKFQGKVGLVMKLGPLAFQEDETHRWGAAVPRVGDWVQVEIRDTRSFEASTRTTASEHHRCRYAEDVDILAILSRPDLVW